MGNTNVLTNKIIDFINENGGCAWRANSVGVFDKRTGFYRRVRQCNKGVADIISCYKGKIMCIEIKSQYEKQREDQITFETRILKAGGIYKLVRKWEDFKLFWDLFLKLENVKWK